MYDYGEFKQELVKRIQEYAGDRFKIGLACFEKNNRTMKEAITAQGKAGKGTAIIYLQELYYGYKHGEPMGWCMCHAIRALDSYNEMVDARHIRGWEEVKGNIFPRLVNREWNREWLKQFPHKRFLDLAIVFKLYLGGIHAGEATTTVSHSLMGEWGITMEDLVEAAGVNLKEEKYAITDIEDVMREFVDIPDGEEKEAGTMYIMSNLPRVYGASALLRSDLLHQFVAEKKSGFYILPSSVHEIILVPDKGEVDVKMLQMLVKEVNTTQVEDDEVLSEGVYYFEEGMTAATLCM